MISYNESLYLSIRYPISTRRDFGRAGSLPQRSPTTIEREHKAGQGQYVLRGQRGLPILDAAQPRCPDERGKRGVRQQLATIGRELDQNDRLYHEATRSTRDQRHHHAEYHAKVERDVGETGSRFAQGIDRQEIRTA